MLGGTRAIFENELYAGLRGEILEHDRGRGGLRFAQSGRRQQKTQQDRRGGPFAGHQGHAFTALEEGAAAAKLAGAGPSGGTAAIEKDPKVRRAVH